MKKHLFIALGFCMIYGIGHAYAGFEWRAPVADTSVHSPSQTRDAEMPIGRAPVAPVQRLDSRPMGAVQTASPDAPTDLTYRDTEDGYYSFGRNIPLGMAVDQIIPDDLSVVYDDGIDRNKPVSWQGDGYWAETLDTVLADHGLSFQVINGKVYVSHLQERTGSAPPQMARHTAAPVPQPVKTLPPLEDVSAPVRNVPAQGDMMARNIQGAAPQPITPRSSQAQAQPQQRPSHMTGAMEFWRAPAGQTLRQTFSNWTNRAGITLYWATDYDYRLAAPIAVEGDFATAAKDVLDAFQSVEPRPYGELMRDSSGGRVLVIRTYGEES